jgi:putative transposase
MTIRDTAFVEGSYYHIYNRGNSKQKIFRDKNDYFRFLKLLYISNSHKKFVIRNFSNKNIYGVDRGNRLVSIGAYCLMPNHFHLLLSRTEKGDISKFMQKLCTSYSMYFNKKYGRVGTLFEGKFKSRLVDSDRYLKYLFSYIHLNPVKIIDPKWKERGIRDRETSLSFIKNYTYSSYPEYIGNKRPENLILDTNDFPKYFPTKKDFDAEILDWITLTT